MNQMFEFEGYEGPCALRFDLITGIRQDDAKKTDGLVSIISFMSGASEDFYRSRESFETLMCRYVTTQRIFTL